MKNLCKYAVHFLFLVAVIGGIVMLFSFLSQEKLKSELTVEAIQDIFFVDATAYNAVEAQTDSMPFITATNLDLRLKPIDQWNIVAVSRDLEKHFPMHSSMLIIIDDKILGEFIVKDRMSIRIEGLAVDILMEDYEVAIEFGRQEVVIGKI